MWPLATPRVSSASGQPGNRLASLAALAPEHSIEANVPQTEMTQLGSIASNGFQFGLPMNALGAHARP
jgi:hypothetical protein